jgi:hypothetical protein
VLSPVPGIKYVHHHKEYKRKQEILFSKSSTLGPGEELSSKCEVRQQRLAENQLIESERKELANHKHQEKITRDEAIVGCLCKKLELGGHLSDEEVGTVKPEYLLRCTLDMSASLKCDELDAFIMVPQDCDKPEFTAKSKIPKKGTLSEAALGERNKIQIAFDS